QLFVGLPSDSDPAQFKKLDELRKQFFFSKKFGDFFEAQGYGPFLDDNVMHDNQALTVYGYPDELDYDCARKRGLFNLEVINKGNLDEVAKLEQLVPQDLLLDNLGRRFTGKWIYLSMGSMGSVDLELMKRLVAILRGTSHKY